MSERTEEIIKALKREITRLSAVIENQRDYSHQIAYDFGQLKIKNQTLRELGNKLADALELLMANQNGRPLPNYTDWDVAMEKAQQALEELEQHDYETN